MMLSYEIDAQGFDNRQLVVREICIDAAETDKAAVKVLKQAFIVIKQLRTHLSFDGYVKIAKSMPGYRVFCLFDEGKIVSYAGFAECLNLYYGNHIWVYDLVTDETKRGKGYGKLLLSCVERYARENMLECVALSSGLQRTDAHRFYEDVTGFDKVSYVFKKDV